MDEVKAQLVINKCESKDVFSSLVSKGLIGVNDLSLIQYDDSSELVDVKYDSTRKKLYYTNDNGDNVDIITVSALKDAMNLPRVSTSGSYNDLDNQPKINNVTLSGNKTTADLAISYNDLSNQPTIPQLTTSYNSTDTSKAMTGVATAKALNGFVSNSRSIVGAGALEGGGDLSANRIITHKNAPTGLETAAIKIGVDEYGHVQAGATISPYEVDAQSATYSFQTSLHGMDARYGTIVILSEHENEEWHTDFQNDRGQKIDFTWVNMLNTPITCTIPYPLSEHAMVYRNGVRMTQSEVLTCPVGRSRRFSLLCIDHPEIGSIVFIDDYYYHE